LNPLGRAIRKIREERESQSKGGGDPWAGEKKKLAGWETLVPGNGGRGKGESISPIRNLILGGGKTKDKAKGKH